MAATAVVCVDPETSDLAFNLEVGSNDQTGVPFVRGTKEWAEDLKECYPRTFAEYTVDDIINDYNRRV